mmetsp:Transcript_50726/g.141596  ORF Transcript_50726/g.141596 Transcript_50726/m.141596 type:complete len:247 (-) Transcript_50726:366-1106(-)
MKRRSRCRTRPRSTRCRSSAWRPSSRRTCCTTPTTGQPAPACASSAWWTRSSWRGCSRRPTRTRTESSAGTTPRSCSASGARGSSRSRTCCSAWQRTRTSSRTPSSGTGCTACTKTRTRSRPLAPWPSPRPRPREHTLGPESRAVSGGGSCEGTGQRPRSILFRPRPIGQSFQQISRQHLRTGTASCSASCAVGVRTPRGRRGREVLSRPAVAPEPGSEHTRRCSLSDAPRPELGGASGAAAGEDF